MDFQRKTRRLIIHSRLLVDRNDKLCTHRCGKLLGHGVFSSWMQLNSTSNCRKVRKDSCSCPPYKEPEELTSGCDMSLAEMGLRGAFDFVAGDTQKE